MEPIQIEWRIAGWAENILVVLIGLAIVGLTAWVVLNAAKDVLDRAARVEEQNRSGSSGANCERSTACRVGNHRKDM